MKNSFLFLGVSIVLVVCMGANGCNQENKPQSIKEELAKTEAQQEIHLKTSPPPRLNRSQERLNLVERLKRFNTDSKVSYIYLIDYGKVMAFYTVKGKVSSVNSLLTQPMQPIEVSTIGGANPAVVVPSPDLDGSYGSNGDAVFFFTTDGTYVEWNGKYMLVDKPLKLTTPVQLIKEVE
jgi:hypothetical protein